MSAAGGISEEILYKFLSSTALSKEEEDMSGMISTLLTRSVYLEISIKSLVTAGAVVGLTGLIIGVLLGIAGVLLKIKVDEREIMIIELLPGANCGGCGFAGCEALAKAIAEGSAAVTACPVASAEVHGKIGEIVGKAADKKIKKTAFVKCAGTCEKTEELYEYHGSMDCKRAAVVPGRGGSSCSYGCMGYGTCVSACMFDAIHIIDGIAVVDKEKCTACGRCVAECPNNIIEIIPLKAEHRVKCSSKAKGKKVREVCKTGCVGCMLCMKQCEYEAISVVNNLAHIDYEKCTDCGKCAIKCPQKIIMRTVGGVKHED